jgi:DNA-binding protein Fis
MRKTSGSTLTPLRVSEQLIGCCFTMLRGLEYLCALMVLEMCGGNRAKAAKVLGIEHAALRRYLTHADLR